MHFHAVPDAIARFILPLHRASRAIIHSNDDFVDVSFVHIFLDLVPDISPARQTSHCRQGIAPARTDLITDYSTGDTADNRAATGGFTFNLDDGNLLHYATIRANSLFSIALIRCR